MKFSLKLLSITLFSILMSSALNAQFGIRLKYNKNTYSDFDQILNKEFQSDKKLFNSGTEIGLDYWFRLKRQRLEFLPEVSYAVASTAYNRITGLDKIKYSGINFNFHTQIYALDFNEDCDCPTFSKQGPSLNKGLFFHVTPGIGYYNINTIISEPSSVAADSGTEGIIFRAGLGVGLDIGMSDILTITPILSYYFNSQVKWEGMPTPTEVYYYDKSNPGLLQLTLRFGLRADYNNGFRRR